MRVAIWLIMMTYLSRGDNPFDEHIYVGIVLAMFSLLVGILGDVRDANK